VPFTDACRGNARFEQLMLDEVDPEGGPCVNMGHCPGDMAIPADIDFLGWVNDVYRQLKADGVEAILRPHPGAPAPIKTKVRKTEKQVFHPSNSLWKGYELAKEDGLKLCTAPTLTECLATAGQVVTLNSNTGVDAAMAGVAVVTMDKGAMAWDIAGHTLDELGILADRYAWACAMAWKQWTQDELANGDAWGHVCPPNWG
jgi:hypothetical protein